MKTSIIKNKKIKKVFNLVIWVIIWTLLSILVDNSVLLPMPSKVLKSFIDLFKLKDFWSSIWNTIYKISIGLFLGILFGSILGFIAYFRPKLEGFIDLPINIISSVPVASITVILLIWINSQKLSIFIVILIVLPNIYKSTKSGLNNASQKLLEMAYVFNVNKYKKIRYIYLDSWLGFLLPSISASVGLAWKSGISSEVLGLVGNSIGEKIYYSKLYLNTADLFAWTIIIIILSNIFEYLLKLIIEKVME